MDEERKKRKLESKDKTWNERRSNTGGMYVDYETALFFHGAFMQIDPC